MHARTRARGHGAAGRAKTAGITVNTVEPGVVLTDLIAPYAAVPEAVAGLEAINALGRIGEPEDVADVVGFLAGPQGRWVTGQTIDVCGSASASIPCTSSSATATPSTPTPSTPPSKPRRRRCCSARRRPRG
ncbi:SDR family oxidoreductase [Streptomyces sp. NPDC050844]|uniref:SDR family oxidoreductase n=1 Tax=Streptomyces sp. NPDC050844 TaxID=3155790 RepID=UPI0033D3228A